MATEQRKTNTDAITNRMDFEREQLDMDADTNPDLITGAPGSHPGGTAAGAAVGGIGAAVVGAAIGSVVPGIGTTVGGVIGAVVGAAGGGVAGHDIAESINPTVEDTYWRENYKTRPYTNPQYTYDDYAPAYRYGWESQSRSPDRPFTEAESDLSSGWEAAKEQSRLDWENARAATADAWERVRRSRGQCEKIKKE